jgi:hypothetical protein
MRKRDAELWAAARLVTMHAVKEGCGRCTPQGCRLARWADQRLREWESSRRRSHVHLATRGGLVSEPTIPFNSAQALCGHVYASRDAARAQALRLAGAGWQVEWRPSGSRLPGTGLYVLARIAHPKHRTSPGELLYACS